MLSRFFLKSSNIERDGFLWNIAGSMLMAFQSVILLMILTRTVGLYDAGVFTLAYANANMFLTVGKYGMRNYQVSDVAQQYSFGEYLSSRIYSTLLMMFFSFVYVVFTTVTLGYKLDKSLIILFMCCFKAVDSIEDVYCGEYQRQERLDIASKIMTLRMGLSLVVYGAVVIISKNLLLSTFAATVSAVVLLVIFLRICTKEYKFSRVRQKSQVQNLLFACFPLAVGAFLSTYIGNAPKYAIDAKLSDELQACYGFIAMPVFIVGLLNSFIFTPMMVKMAKQWNDKSLKKFIRSTLFQVVIVVVITLACLAGAYLVGIPVLSLLYNTDLQPYKKELLILLLGGGFLGLSGLLNALLTIMRKQKMILISYGIVSLIALVLSNRVVERDGILGASIMYVALMILLCMLFTGEYVLCVVRAAQKNH